MEYLTHKTVEAKLRSMQNRFNRDNLSEDILLSDVIFIMYDPKTMKKRTRQKKQSFLFIKIDQYYRELVKEYDHVVVTKGKYGKHYIHPKGRGGKLYHPVERYISERLNTTVEMVYEEAEEMNKIYADKCTTSEVEFPTGNIIFANFFKNSAMDDYAFEMPEDLKYKSEYSINYDIGVQRTMRKLSELHGLGYVQLGNTTADIYKVGEDKIIMTTSYAYYPDENDEFDVDIPAPEEWEHIGDVCCDVWRLEFIDQQNFDKGDTLPLDHKEYDYNKPCRCKVNPGTWKVTNRYHFMDDQVALKNGEYPIWCELTRIKE